MKLKNGKPFKVNKSYRRFKLRMQILLKAVGNINKMTISRQSFEILANDDITIFDLNNDNEYFNFLNYDNE